MATTDVRPAAASRKWVGVAVVGLAAAGVAAALAWPRTPPQMGADEKAFKTVDALYTAVRARDAERVGECEGRLHGYRDAGALTPDAAEYLDDVIARARGGRWESAAERLYGFMLAQRREGAEGPAPRKKERGKRG